MAYPKTRTKQGDDAGDDHLSQDTPVERHGVEFLSTLSID
jgi:hypothetical protein